MACWRGLSQLATLVVLSSFTGVNAGVRADDEPALVEQVFDAKALAASERERESLAECIASIVAPSSWDAAGGAATHQWRGGKLAISNTAEACHQVGKLLDVLATLPAAGAKDAIKAPKAARLDVSAFNNDDESFEIVVYPVLDILSARGRIDPRAEGAEFDTDALIEVVTSVVAPTTWDAVGGNGGIREYEPRGALVVSQSKAIHERIESLFAALRKAPTAADVFKKIRGTRTIDAGTDDSTGEKLRIAVYPVPDLVLTVERDEVADFESLIEVIATGVAPETWDAVGGSGTVREFATHNVLVVSQTKEAHGGVEKLLTALRKIPPYTEAAARAEPQPPVVVGTQKNGDAELQVVVYDVGRRILTRDGIADFEGLFAAIWNIDEATWIVNGGQGTITEFVHRGALVVVNTKEVQAKVRKVIDEYKPTVD